VPDGALHILAISEAAPSKTHDKTLSDHLHTIGRVPTGYEADADKGYQGLTEQGSQVTVTAPQTGAK